MEQQKKNENQGKEMIPSFQITIFRFLLTTSEEVYDVFGISHLIHVLLAKTKDAEWLKATCIINLREDWKN